MRKVIVNKLFFGTSGRGLNLPVYIVLAVVFLFAGCTQSAPPGPTNPSQTASIAPAPRILSADVLPDPSLASYDIADPYAELSNNIKESLNPDRALYNTLYRAADAMLTSVDVSSLRADPMKIAVIKDCLYAAPHLYYIASLDLSADGGTVILTYNGDSPEEIYRNKESFTARLSHLVYNIAPPMYTDIQKALSVYHYLCKTTNYTGNIQDESTYSPYSILVKGQGICNGFSNLAEYVFSRVGVPAEYAANGYHAWNIVTVCGKRYHMDITFGTGWHDTTVNWLSTAFMDDGARIRSLLDNEVGIGQIIIGYPRDNPEIAAACTDTNLSAYNAITVYALDIDSGKVYYADWEGIKRMNLDCTGVEPMATNTKTFQMAFYDGTLYYLGGDGGQLYRLLSDGTSELLDQTQYLTYLDIVNGELRFGTNADGSGYKGLVLSPHETAEQEDTVSLPGASVSRVRSFSVNIAFSECMDISAKWSDFIKLESDEGYTVQSHLIWHPDGKTLTIRSKECVADMDNLKIYIKRGAPSAAGGLLPNGYLLKIDIIEGE